MNSTLFYERFITFMYIHLITLFKKERFPLNAKTTTLKASTTIILRLTEQILNIQKTKNHLSGNASYRRVAAAGNTKR